MKNKTVGEKKKSTTKDAAKMSDKSLMNVYQQRDMPRLKVTVKDQNGSKSCEFKIAETRDSIA